ncbi:MAG: AtpZ/AtpI family protein [Elusimicrobia bacterium]|nr:AtpZ/AtpI family protein [Elusimicrobiota bacterium]MDE2426724.1 AtpZ/AtpI family protein [Elusimicrobiota bacterium]
MPDDPSKPRRFQNQNAYALAFGLGAELLGALAVGAVPGWWVDREFNTSPWGILIGVFIGIGLAIFQLIRSASQHEDGDAPRH